MWWALLVSAWAADPDGVDAVREALTPRHDPGCTALPDLGSDLREALVEVAEETAYPPWVPVRAAGCLVDLAGTDPDALRVALGWTRDAARPAFTLVVAARLDRLPVEVAVPLAEAAVDRALGDARLTSRVGPVLARSTHPDVVARAQPLLKRVEEGP